MKTIYKYEIEITDKPESIEVPQRSEILRFGIQNHKLFVWILVDTSDEYTLMLRFRIFGTGHPIPQDEPMRYMDSVEDRGFVWHIFKKDNKS